MEMVTVEQLQQAIQELLDTGVISGNQEVYVSCYETICFEGIDTFIDLNDSPTINTVARDNP